MTFFLPRVLLSFDWLMMGAVITAILFLLVTPAQSHEIRPMLVDFKFDKGGSYELVININLETWLARIDANLKNTSSSKNTGEYDRLRKLPGPDLRKLFEQDLPRFTAVISLGFDGVRQALQYEKSVVAGIGDLDLIRKSTVHFTGKIPAGVTSVEWKYAAGPSVFRVRDKDVKDNEDGSNATYVADGASSGPMTIYSPVKRGAFASFIEYIKIGFIHIVPKGLDHILFVVGLFLLSTKLSPLLWQVTTFTIAHTVTLGLGITGIVSIPANIVEPLIAASIVYVAVENIFTDRLSRWRPVVVFLFGLLHGLGFAAVLKEIGLGSDNFIAGLLGFNVGVELGQLLIIGICFLLVGFWFGRKNWYHKIVTIPGSTTIALIGGWWFYERVFLA